jgi:hypothetical protein
MWERVVEKRRNGRGDDEKGKAGKSRTDRVFRKE